MTTLPRIALAVALSTAIAAPAARAIDIEEETSAAAVRVECAGSDIWLQGVGACVAPDDRRLDDDMRFEAARSLAAAGRYGDALSILAEADDPEDPRILNYKGFATRMAGDIRAALVHYRRALARDPDYHLARSYMGMGLMELGDIEGARAQLQEIANRGGSGTRAYAALRDALRDRTGY